MDAVASLLIQSLGSTLHCPQEAHLTNCEGH